jgi:ubiquinone/menaquinone biosynthesis C-methylase UbiE
MGYLREMAEGGYDADHIGDFHRFMVPRLCDQHGVGKSDRIVDIGAGQGHCLLPLHENGWQRLIAVDIDDFNFPLFRERPGISTLRCDIESMPLEIEDNSVGAVFCLHLIEHLSNPGNLLREAHRVLESNGRLFLVTPDWRKQYRTFWRDPTHLHPYDKESIDRLLRIHRFRPQVMSWGTAFGLGRIGAYRRFPRLGLMGADILAVATK